MISIILCRANDLVGNIVADVEHNDIVHVALNLHSGWVVAEEAVGLWGRPEAQYAQTVEAYPLPVSAEQERKILDWLLTRVGTGYDFLADLIDGANLVFKTAFQIPKTGRYNCSGVIAEACYFAGWYPFGDIPPRNILPADWAKFFRRK